MIMKLNKRTAFTMIELIFVIVIMGIIGKFGTEFLAQAYKSFIFSKINNELQSKSATAVEFITKRLEYRIKQSTIARNVSGGYPGVYNYVNNTGLADPNATVLEWIAADIDGFRGISDLNATPYMPNWSGVIDLTASTATRLVSPGTDTNKLNTLISNLATRNTDINDTAIYFIGSFLTTNPWGYNGVISTQSETLHPIRSNANPNELVPKVGTNFSGTTVSEYYKLAWTAYAVELGDYDSTTKTGNLYFYYDYRPWKGENYSAHGIRVLLAEGINTFRYRSAGSLLKIQVCAKSNLKNEEYALCKEKTVY